MSNLKVKIKHGSPQLVDLVIRLHENKKFAEYFIQTKVKHLMVTGYGGCDKYESILFQSAHSVDASDLETEVKFFGAKSIYCKEVKHGIQVLVLKTDKSNIKVVYEHTV